MEIKEKDFDQIFDEMISDVKDEPIVINEKAVEFLRKNYAPVIALIKDVVKLSN